ncbi:MAG TPA: bifunctional 3-(3-hydroxy-phenyl)propionate/3-hydroxycinnamic acid hydroxylase [Herbaspirillum sp.]
MDLTINNIDLDADVLIVGAGPTGLTLANVLGRNGVDVVIIDRKQGTVAEPRAVSIDDESLRTMQAIGLADEVMRDVVSGYGVHYMTGPGGSCFGKVEPTASDYGYPRRNAFRQPLFEATLRAGLKRFPCVRMLFGHTLESFAQDARQVTAVVSREDGARFNITARYMVGSDGGRSPVREALGVAMAGSTFKSRWLVVDTDRDDDPFTQMRVYCDARRPLVDVPGPHGTRRYEVLIHPREDADAALAPERIAALLRPLRGDKPVHLVRKVVYTFHARMAERWRTGRIFLAGDAAHLTPPYAGQGMNSGVRDAHNLGWKLAAAMQGRLSDAALDSYEQERRGHAWALIRLALNLGEVMAPRTRVHGWLIYAFFHCAAYIPPLRDYFLQMKFKPKPRYSSGLLGLPDAPADLSRRGYMLPQPMLTLSDGSPASLDSLMGDGFALVAYGAAGYATLAALDHPLWKRLAASRVWIADAAGQPSPHLQAGGILAGIDSGSVLAPTLAPHVGKILLVRPDRYIAGAFTPGGEQAFAEDYAARLGVDAGQTLTPAAAVSLQQA